MKNKKSDESFLEQLKGVIGKLREMKKDETHVLSVNAQYGHYQIIIGPEKEAPRGNKQEQHEIEINGEIHHIFVSSNSVRTQPSRQQMMDNLKNTIIMRDISVHLKDPKGDGKHLEPASVDESVHPRECINFAGKEGEKILEEANSKGRFPMATYKIIQKDILTSLKERRDDSLETLD